MTNASLVGSIKLPSAPIDWLRVGFGIVLVGLIYYAYWVGPGHEFSCYWWLTTHWRLTSSYSHGPLIPVIAAGLVWWKRAELKSVRLLPANRGITIVALAMFFYWFGYKANQPRAIVLSFVILLYGLVLGLAGREVLRVLFFPITFLLLMIPLNFLDEAVGFPLRMLMTSSSASLLNFIGVDTIRRGTALYSPTGLFQLDVAAPCSGIRSLMALLTVTAAFGYVTQHVQWKRWVLFLSAMPLSVLGNMARVSSIAIVAQVYGKRFATTDYHDAAGFIVYGVALTAMVALGFLLNLPYRRLFDNWLRPLKDSRNVAGKPLPPVQQRETL